MQFGEPAAVQAPTDGAAATAEGAVALAEQAITIADDYPSQGVAALREALAAFDEQSPELGADAEAQKVRARAQLTLARALLSANDATGARAAMDEAIRTARGDALPVKGFGPGLDALHRERTAVLEDNPRGSIEVHCSDPCRVLINGREASTSNDGLLAGRYRIHVTSMTGGAIEPLSVTLDVNGTESIEWPVANAPAPAAATPEPKRDRNRILPRWSEAVLVAAGAAAVGVGAVLIAIDGRCPGGSDPLDVENCPEVYTTQMSGIATLAAGGAVFLVSGVLLTVDEVRVGRGKTRTVGLALRGRF
jgi:hypothetical protein